MQGVWVLLAQQLVFVPALVHNLYNGNGCVCLCVCLSESSVWPDLAAVPAPVSDLHRLEHQPPLVRVRRVLDLTS